MKIELPLQIIQIDHHGIHLMIHLVLNGLRANAIVDTGASRSVIDLNRIRYYLGDTPLKKENRLFTGIGEGSVEPYSVIVPGLSFGPIDLKDETLVVIDLHPINKAYAVYDLPRADMVLGSDILIRLDAVIDYAKRLLTVSKSL